MNDKKPMSDNRLMTDKDLRPGETPSPEKKVPSFRQSRVNPVGQEDEKGPCKDKGRDEPQAIPEFADIDPSVDPVDQEGHAQGSHQQPDLLPVRQAIQELKNFFRHTVTGPFTASTLGCLGFVTASLDFYCVFSFLTNLVVLRAFLWFALLRERCGAHKSGRVPSQCFYHDMLVHYQDMISLCDHKFLLAFLCMAFTWTPETTVHIPVTLASLAGFLCAWASIHKSLTEKETPS